MTPEEIYREAKAKRQGVIPLPPPRIAIKPISNPSRKGFRVKNYGPRPSRRKAA